MEFKRGGWLENDDFFCADVCRSVGEIPACAEFDCSLLENTEWLNSREIELNDLTVETIQHKWEHPSQWAVWAVQYSSFMCQALPHSNLLFPQNNCSTTFFLSWHFSALSPFPRLTTVEEELLDLARTMGSQQASLEQLELELEEEREGIKKGQRWADNRPEPRSAMLWYSVQKLYKVIPQFSNCGDKAMEVCLCGQSSPLGELHMLLAGQQLITSLVSGGCEYLINYNTAIWQELWSLTPSFVLVDEAVRRC